MSESSFEGTLVLEKLAEIGKVEEFYDSVDSDDLKKARALLIEAGLDASTINIVLQKMSDGDDEH